MEKINSKKGIIALPIVVLLTIIIVSIAIGLSTVSYNENVSSFGASKSATALSYALSGVEDALKRIARDKTTDTSYTLNYSGSDLTTACPAAGTSQECARVSIDYEANKSPTIITSAGTSGTYIRKMQVNVMVDSNGAIVSRTAMEIKSLPTISTAQASLSAASMILNGWVNPNGNTANAWFRYHTTAPTVCTDDTGVWSGSTRAPSSGSVSITGNGGYSPASIASASITVIPGTTYYYCAIADDGTTKVYGNVFRVVAI